MLGPHNSFNGTNAIDTAFKIVRMLEVVEGDIWGGVDIRVYKGEVPFGKRTIDLFEYEATLKCFTGEVALGSRILPGSCKSSLFWWEG